MRCCVAAPPPPPPRPQNSPQHCPAQWSCVAALSESIRWWATLPLDQIIVVCVQWQVYSDNWQDGHTKLNLARFPSRLRLRTRWWWLAIKIPCPANLPCPGVTQNYRMSLSALSTSSTPLSPSPHSYERWYPHFCEIEYRYPIIVAQWHTLWSPSLLLCTTVILKFLQNILWGARVCRAIKLSTKFCSSLQKAFIPLRLLVLSQLRIY